MSGKMSKLEVQVLAFLIYFFFGLECISAYNLIIPNPQSSQAWIVTLFMGIEIAILIPVVMQMASMYNRLVALGRVV